MWTSLVVLMIGALLVGAATLWVLAAYRRAGGDARSARVILLACAAVGSMTLGAYLFNGRPELAGAPYQQRLEALRRQPIESYSAEEALAVFTADAKDRPNDPRPLIQAGRVLLMAGRPQEAARSFDAALRREPRQATALVGMGEALVVINGAFTPDALALFQQAATLSNDPAPWVYQAMAARQQGRTADARRFWGEALSRMSPDDPMRPVAQRLSAER